MHNGVNECAAWDWINAVQKRSDWTAPMTSSDGFRYHKLKEEHVELITNSLADNYNITLRATVGLVDDGFHAQVSQKTVRRALDGVSFMLKKTHRDNDHRNSPVNIEKHRVAGLSPT